MREALHNIRHRIARAATASGRTPADVRLIAVSKTHPVEAIVMASQLGVRDFGENRVQEAESKITALRDAQPAHTWHLIGHLQRNKAKRAAQLFDYVHSVDSAELIASLSRHRSEQGGAPLRVLFQCNISGELSKEGLDARDWQHDTARFDALRRLIVDAAALPNIALCGLMTIAPFLPDPEETRPIFASLRSLLVRLQREVGPHPFDQLSMGMSGDVEVAIAEGATMVRVGRALFGERDYGTREGQGV
jgi:pyridoxal phosphate enzyme (YggS family)